MGTTIPYAIYGILASLIVFVIADAMVKLQIKKLVLQVPSVAENLEGATKSE